jgi:hypothetical protein
VHAQAYFVVLFSMMTMANFPLDVLLAQQFMQLDMILRAVRCNNMPFGGVLILGKK